MTEYDGWNGDHIRVLELPGPIDKLETVGGRVYAHMSAGQVIDVTDWFADELRGH